MREMIKQVSIILLTLLFSVLLTPITALAQTVNSTDAVTLAQNETIDEDYFATGETVSLSGTVNGDAYLAGGTVYVDGTVNGDLLVAGGTITIRGDIMEDLRAFGGTITVTGTVGGNITTAGGTVLLADGATLSGSLVAGAGTLEILAPIGKGATFGAGQATIGSLINGNVLAGIGTMSLTNEAQVQGNLTYYSDFDGNLTQAESSSISGELTHIIPVKDKGLTGEEKEAALTGAGLFLKMLSLFSSLLLGLLLIHFFPVFTKNTTDNINNRLLLSLLIGFITFIVTPILVLLLIVTLIGIPFAIIIVPLLLALIFFAKIFSIIFIGQQIMKFLSQKTSVHWVLIVGIIAYGILTSIPVFGFILSFLSVLAGTGALFLEKKKMYHTLRSKKLV